MIKNVSNPVEYTINSIKGEPITAGGYFIIRIKGMKIKQTSGLTVTFTEGLQRYLDPSLKFGPVRRIATMCFPKLILPECLSRILVYLIFQMTNWGFPKLFKSFSRRCFQRSRS